MVCEVKCTRIDKAKMIDRNATCLDDCIATIVTYFGRDYELMFVNSWEFDFKLGDTVQEIEEIIDERAYFQYLMEGHGVLIKKHQLKGEELLSLMEAELEQGKPFIVGIDPYWCEWDPSYQKIHYVHAFVVSGMEETGKDFVCVDPFYNLEGKLVNREVMAKSCFVVFSCELKEAVMSIEDAYAKLIQCAKERYDKDGENCCTKIRNFGKIFLNQKKGLECSDGSDIWKTPLYKLLCNALLRRQKYLNALRYVAKKMGRKLDYRIETKMQELFYKWNEMRGMIIKILCCTTLSEQFCDRISAVADIIADKEEELARTIAENGFFAEKNGKESSKAGSDDKDESGDMVTIDLRKYYNNKGFDTFPPKYKKTDFTGTGFYYIIDEKKKTKLLKKLDGEFDTNIYAGDTCDNVSCANQIVQVPKNHYNQMKLLIVAEYGTYAGEFSFMKDKSKRYSIWVEADEWISDNPKKNPVWDDVIGFRSENEVVNESRNHSIYEVTCELNSDEYVNAIKLPFCPNMHIFAITLITSGTDNQKVLR